MPNMLRSIVSVSLSVVVGNAVGCNGGDGGREVVFGPGGPFFPPGMFFDQDVSALPPAPTSAAAIASLRRAGGWGYGDRFHIDFSMEVLRVDGTDHPTRMFRPTEDFYEPDCDHVEVPVPEDGNVEGEEGYACDQGGDCHLIVWAPDQHQLFEMWRAHMSGSRFDGGCLAVWDTSRVYGPTARGDQCTAADAAGFPIAPMLFTADEVAAGSIDHAIRFVMPNDRIQDGFVRPATHGTHTTGGADAPHYGFHLRLRADFPLDQLPSDGARVVARALQRYGMYHADGGEVVLTAASDRRTTAKWQGLLDAEDLAMLRVEDFEVIDHGPPIALTLECVRAD